ncbi:MAG: hypothetical protein WB995_11410, partial [Candidatus Acidiferrales bacterium]
MPNTTRRVSTFALTPAAAILTLISLSFASGASAQAPSRFPAHATHYDVDVTLHPADQTISAKAKVEFLADAPARTLLVELHQDLKVISALGANGKPLEFDRDRNNPLDLRVNLPEALVAGKTAAVTFEYAGPLSLEDDSPTKGIRLGS